MSQTVNQIAVEMVEAAGGDSTADSKLLTQCERWVSDVYGEIVPLAEWTWSRVSEQIVLLADTAEYNLSAGREPYSARLAGSIDQKMEMVDVEMLQGYDLELTGRPIYFYVSGYASDLDKIKVWPIPDVSYTLEVYERLRPAKLDPGDTVPMPQEMLVVLKKGVMNRVLYDDREYSAAAQMKRDYDQLLGLAIKRANKRSATEPQLREVDVPRQFKPGARLDPAHYRNW